MAPTIPSQRPRKSTRTREQRQRLRAVHTMLSETAWLDGQPRWADAGVAWESERRSLVPGVHELSLAQRRLYQARHQDGSTTPPADVQATVERRLERLELAKRLHELD